MKEYGPSIKSRDGQSMKEMEKNAPYLIYRNVEERTANNIVENFGLCWITAGFLKKVQISFQTEKGSLLRLVIHWPCIRGKLGDQ